MRHYIQEDLNLISARLRELVGSEPILVLCFEDGEIINEFRGHGLDVWGLCLSPDCSSVNHPLCLSLENEKIKRRSFKWSIYLEASNKILNWGEILQSLQSLGVENFLVPLANYTIWEYEYERQLIALLISNGFELHLADEGVVRPLFWYRKGQKKKVTDQAYKYEIAIVQTQYLLKRQSELLIAYRMELMQLENELFQTTQQLEQHEIELSQTTHLLEQREIELSQTTHLLEQRETELSQTTHLLEQRETDLSQAVHQYEAFWASRSGRTLLAFQSIKKRLGISRMLNGIKAMIHLIFKSIALVRRDGLLRGARILYHHLLRFLRVSWVKVKLRTSHLPDKGVFLQIEAIQPTSSPEQHTIDVDIIICVHNALQDVKNCLDSVLSFTSSPYKIILVDDGSETETEKFLESFINRHPKIATLIKNKVARGYTFAANQGIRASSADFILLLNSDTIVTPEWLDRLISCAESDDKIGIVGPLSNTASWQSIPRIEENGDWASNPLPQDISIELMGRLVSKYSGRLFPHMPFLNGFCILIKRELLNDVGIFDEDNFGQGYGEEDDLVLRARNKGWHVALADDTYIYHAQSRSYSDEKRKILSDRAGKILATKHGTAIVEDGVRYCLDSLILNGIRARAEVFAERTRLIEQGRNYSGKRILLLLPVEVPGGGANIALLESLAMKKMGVSIEIFNLPSYQDGFRKSYPNLEIPVRFHEPSFLPQIAHDYDAVIATHNSTVAWLAPIKQTNPEIRLGYYIQGFEPLMYERGTSGYQTAYDSYGLIPDLVRFTKTQWTRNEVLRNTGVDSHIIGISMDIDLFRPRPDPLHDKVSYPIRIAAMVRPESPYREPEKTMRILKKAHQKYHALVKPIIFGTQEDNPDFLQLPIDFPWDLYGTIPSQKVAAVLNTADIFLDYSSHQAMGLTALEAMAVGCAVIVPENGGAVTFCHHMHNGLVVDTTNFDTVWQALQLLVEDDNLRFRLQKQAIFDVCQFHPERTALNILKTLWGE